ncbi:NHL repeat-containing protein [Mucilaginibacter ginkgonis]|uniref:Uncharacterized protein n=1 Tax=Mucilaginibacter ginkgonis TaxID=2682091 RepID=A0A6I4HYM4_9SPHI|nr:6-bladed beta-propeller [Mucilaginibacter ginkgonis]QQL50294.1 hypothetical protein GO620_002230 [Mucilaginibacter ginkgonis]
MSQHNIILGHGDFQYKVNASRFDLNPAEHPVNNCHEMVLSKNGLLYLLTDDIRNNVIIYNKDGKYVNSWGTTYPGAHGLTLSNEGGTEFLYITDTVRHQVIKTTLDGRELMVLDYPKEIALYQSADEYKPTETAIAANGDIYVTDGYGHQFVIQYDSTGNCIRHWGGRGTGEANFDCAHGVAIDIRDANNPRLIITSRNENAFKYFTMDGNYLGQTVMPGSFVCRPVIDGENIYAAVFRSGDNQNFGSGYITILDKHKKVVSSPGATEPIYVDGVLQPQQKIESAFVHPHDVCVDADENLIIPQWNSGKTYPVFLKRV